MEAGAPASADLMNPEAVALFLQLTHERYYQELKEYFGNTIIGILLTNRISWGAAAKRE